VNANTAIFVAVVGLGLLVARRTPVLWQRLVPLSALLGLLLLAPRVSDNLAVLTPVYIGAMLGAGWNIIGGYTGYGSFGQVAFFGFGAYAMAGSIATTESYLGLPAGLGLVIAGVACALYALVVGLPILRLRGHYFAISTLTFGIATQQLIKNLDFLGGTSGISTPIIRHPHVLGFEVDRDTYFYFLAFILTALAVLATWVVSRSKFGYGLQAIRENEDAAAAMGINTTRYKLQAFVIAAVITGVAGALEAYLRSGVSPEDDGVFQLRFNLLPLIIALIGGVGTVWGPLIGAFTFLGIEHVLTSASGSSTFVQDWERVITGGIIVAVVLFLPRGLVQLVGSRGPRGWRIFADNLRATRV
jgi:branched-chain amino acid transport system permease protein